MRSSINLRPNVSTKLLSHHLARFVRAKLKLKNVTQSPPYPSPPDHSDVVREEENMCDALREQNCLKPLDRGGRHEADSSAQRRISVYLRKLEGLDDRCSQGIVRRTARSCHRRGASLQRLHEGQRSIRGARLRKLHAQRAVLLLGDRLLR